MSGSEAAYNDRWLFSPRDHAVAVAIRERDVEGLRRLGAAGVAEFAKLCRDGEDALDWALNYFDTRGGPELEQVCDELLNLGVPLARADGKRLCDASWRQMSGALGWLLARGHPTSERLLNTCLFHAVSNLWYPCSAWGAEIRQTLRLLVSAGADPNSLDEGHDLPLRWAADECAASEEHSTLVMEELIALGANVLQTGYSGWTALDAILASEDPSEATWDFLYDRPPINDRIEWAEKWLREHPSSEHVVPVRFLIDAMRLRLPRDE